MEGTSVVVIAVAKSLNLGIRVERYLRGLGIRVGVLSADNYPTMSSPFPARTPFEFVALDRDEPAVAYLEELAQTKPWLAEPVRRLKTSRERHDDNPEVAYLLGLAHSKEFNARYLDLVRQVGETTMETGTIICCIYNASTSLGSVKASLENIYESRAEVERLFGHGPQRTFWTCLAWVIPYNPLVGGDGTNRENAQGAERLRKELADLRIKPDYRLTFNTFQVVGKDHRQKDLRVAQHLLSMLFPRNGAVPLDPDIFHEPDITESRQEMTG